MAFSAPLAVANLVSWLLITLDNLIVSRELSPVALGFYVLAFNVSSWPMSAVGQAVRVVALPAFSDTDSAEQRNDGLVRSIGPVVLVACFMGLGLATLAGPVVAVLYGDRWAAAATALAGLAVFGAIRVVLDLVATFLIAAGETRQVLVVQLVWLAAMVPAMVLSVREWGLVGRRMGPRGRGRPRGTAGLRSLPAQDRGRPGTSCARKRDPPGRPSPSRWSLLVDRDLCPARSCGSAARRRSRRASLSGPSGALVPEALRRAARPVH